MINDTNLYNKGIKKVLSANNLTELNNCTILVVGSNGLIGSAIIDVLNYLNKYYGAEINIIGTVRDSNKLLERFLDYDNLKIIKYDVNKKLDIDDNIDYIINAASNAHPSSFSNEPVQTITSNIIGTNNLLDFTYNNKCKKLLYVSSGEIYGQPREDTIAFDEDYNGRINPINIRSCYPLGKLAAENLCIAYSNQYHINATIVRPCHTYGPTQTTTDSRVTAQFIRNVLNNQDIVMKSEGTQIRSYCYVLDTATGILTALLKGNNKEAYNISNNNVIISIKDLANIIAESANKQVLFDIPTEKEKRSYNPVTRSVLDGTKLEGLGWKPCYNIKDGINETIKIMSRVKKKD